MNKHTPGPWAADSSNITRGRDIIALCYDPEDTTHCTKIAKANARLIAAAPDQNDALLAVEKWWRLPNSERTIEAIEPAMRLVIAAIAKAGGTDE